MTETAEVPAPSRGGRIIIEWPVPGEHGMPGWGVSLFDADTGIQVKTAMRLIVDPTEMITAVATVFADKDGNPVFDDDPVPNEAGDGIRTVDVAFEVAGMRFAGEAS